MDKLIIICVCYVLYVLLLLLIPYKRKSMKTSCGNCILSFSHKFSYRNILILAAAAIIISLIYFFYWSLLPNIAVAGCGVLAAYTASKEIAYSDLYGVYDKGLCFDGTYIPYEQISSINEVDNRMEADISIRVTYKNNKVRTIRFSSDSEKKVVLAKLKALKVI